MKHIQDWAGIFFVGSVFVLTVIAIFGIWEIVGRDVIEKSISTLGILAFVTVIILIAGRFLDRGHEGAMAQQPLAIFAPLRAVTLAILVTSVTLLALIGILAIWEVIQDREVLMRSLSSMGIIAFSSFVVVMVSLERENHPLWVQRGKSLSVGGAILILLGAWMLWGMMSSFYY